MTKKNTPLITKDEKSVKITVIGIISEQIGVNPSDIKLEDRLGGDLHMSASDISDLSVKLKEKDLDLSEINLETTVESLVEDLSF